MKMYCWKCGKDIQDGAKFCIFCGAAAIAPGGMSSDKGKKVQRDVRAYVVIGIVVVLIMAAAAIAVGMLLPEEKTVEEEVFSESIKVAAEKKRAKYRIALQQLAEKKLPLLDLLHRNDMHMKTV